MNAKKKKSPSIKNLSAAARYLGIDRKGLEDWRNQGCPGIPPEKFNEDEIKKWAAAHGKKWAVAETGDLRARKTLEEIRKLKLKNDRDEGKVTENTRIVECFARLSSRINAYRLKSESEDPVELDKVEGIPAKRATMRRIWVDIMRELQSAGEEFTK